MTTHCTIAAVRLGLAFLTGFGLVGCSAAQVQDQLPAGYGLPQGTPSRPDAVAPFPLVHDMPPERRDALMDEDEKEKLKRDLLRTRDRQDKLTAEDKNASGASGEPSSSIFKRKDKTTDKSKDPSKGKPKDAAKPAAQAPSAATGTGRNP